MSRSLMHFNSPIDDRLQHTQMISEDLDEDEDNIIICTFIPLLPSTHREDISIKNTLDYVQNEEHPVEWL